MKQRKRHYLILIFTILMAREALAQGESLGIGTSTPSNNAVLHVESSNKGFLMPRYSANSANRAHSVPAVNGMLFYDKTGNNVMLNDGTTWVAQGFFPIGAITMWGGTTPPAGWVLCDGNNGTPNLQGKFIVGYDPGDADYNSIGKEGGQNHVTLGVNHLPSHSHTVYDPGHTHSASVTHLHRYAVEEYSSRNLTKNMVGGGGSPSYQETITTTSASFAGTVSVGSAAIGSTSVGYSGGGQPHENRPPYFVLAFIMRVN